MTKVIINPEFGTKEIAVAMGVRMLKNGKLSMQDVLDFTDNEILRTVEDDEVVDAENPDVTADTAEAEVVFA